MASILKVGQVAITVSNVPRALAFYRDILNLEFLFSPSDELAFLSASNVRIMLSTPQGSGTVGANSVLYYQIEGIEKAFEEWQKAGATVEREPALTAKMPDHDLWMGFLRDPDNNLVGIMEEVRS